MHSGFHKHIVAHYLPSALKFKQKQALRAILSESSSPFGQTADMLQNPYLTKRHNHAMMTLT